MMPARAEGTLPPFEDFWPVRFSVPVRAALLVLPLLGLTGCGVLHIFDPTVRQRGSRVDPDALKELIPGTSSRADVQALIGSPTAKATFDDNTWIYISQLTTTRIGRTPGVRQQNVVIMTFDPNGTLRGITQRDKADAAPIAMAAGATPSPGSEASFLQQLFGNVGRFTPAGLPGGGAGGLGGGGSNNPTTGPGSTGNSLR
jgi:outer membrane protein assembly factor BamE (lipoprotein component of BamABCDE complex)